MGCGFLQGCPVPPQYCPYRVLRDPSLSCLPKAAAYASRSGGLNANFSAVINIMLLLFCSVAWCEAVAMLFVISV